MPGMWAWQVNFQYPQIWVVQSCLLELVLWDLSVCVCVGGMFIRMPVHVKVTMKPKLAILDFFYAILLYILLLIIYLCFKLYSQ